MGVTSGAGARLFVIHPDYSIYKGIMFHRWSFNCPQPLSMSVMNMGSSHVLRLRSMIDRQFAGKIWNMEDVHWLGKSGLTAERLADTSDPDSVNYREELLRIQPTVIVLIIGSNDLDKPGLGAGSSGAVEEVLHWMGKVVEWIRPLTKTVLLMPLLTRIFPRTAACSFRKKYPGRGDYMHLSF